MKNMISKTKFKLRASHYFHEVEKAGKHLIISDRGKPVVKIVSYSEGSDKDLPSLRNTVIKFKDPTERVNFED